MSHLDEHDVVMFAMGDADSEHVREHLAGCEQCSARLAEVRELLAATEQMEVPEPAAGLEARVWERQREVLAERGVLRDRQREAPGARVVPFWNRQRAWSAVAVAAMLVVAFLVGLYQAPPGSEIVPSDTVPGRDRVLFVAVGDHLESARMVLVELVNAPAADRVDISAQQARAATLLADNRVYRQSAELAGQTAVADLLTDLERVLLEVARASEEVPGDELDWLRERIATGDLLFKVNVIEGQTRRAAMAAADGDEL